MSRSLLLDTDEPGVQVGIKEKGGAVNFVRVQTIYEEPVVDGNVETQVITVITTTGDGTQITNNL